MFPIFVQISAITAVCVLAGLVGAPDAGPAIAAVLAFAIYVTRK